MLPKTHMIYGALFSILLFLFKVDPNYCILVFFASFLIDFDHYSWYVIRKKDISLKKAYYHLKDNVKKKLTLMIFHTIEFHIFVLLLSYFWIGFFYIFIGMLFHSLLDLIDLYSINEIKFREFFLIKYLISDKKNYA